MKPKSIKAVMLFLFITIILLRSDVLKMKRTEPYEREGKCWSGAFYKPNEFLNSIWLTDKEYYNLLANGIIETIYKGEKIEIMLTSQEKL